MPRYHLNLFESYGEASDDEGTHLPDLDAARQLAITGIRSILAEDVTKGELNLAGRLEVTDADGVVLLTMAFDEVVTIVRSTK